MTIEPASPEPPKRDLGAQVRLGTLAFLCLCTVIAWIIAANYDPSKSAPAKKDEPVQTLATESAPVDENTPLPPTATDASLREETTPQTPPATDPVPVNDGTPAPPTATNSGPTATVSAAGAAGVSRDDPIPALIPVDVGDGLILTIVGAIRPADSILSAADPFILPPGPEQEFLQVNVQLTCSKPVDETCFFSIFELKAVGADDIVREAEWFIEGIDGLLEDGDYAGGSTWIGRVFFVIPKDDPTMVLYHESFLLGDIIYLSLP